MVVGLRQPLLARIRDVPKSVRLFSLSSCPRWSPLQLQRKGETSSPEHPRGRRHNALHLVTATIALGTIGTPADLVTNTFVIMAGRASNAAGRYNLRPRGRRGEGELRGAAALADSPLLGRLLEDLAAVFDAEVLPLLDATTRVLLGRVGQACRDAVLRSPKLPCAGRTVGVKLKGNQFIVSVQLLAWARENDCPWDARVCSWAAEYGQLEALRWAREHQCPWTPGGTQVGA